MEVSPAVATPNDGNTPLSSDELADLIPNLATQEELNEFERENILQARAWVMAAHTTARRIVSEEYVRRLHSRMFGQTWKWAGQHRKTERNLGVPAHEIPEKLAVLFGDVRYWIDHDTHPPDEIAVRFHHRLVAIHPFPNRNGRHARLIAEALVMKLGRPVLTWGNADLGTQGDARTRYLEALRTADEHDYQLLLAFARS
jgi:Fic-DOC domain mobile mystery protein B